MTLAFMGTGTVKPGSKEWLKLMTASKIAAVMGHSEYDSYFSLWHRMKGNIGTEEENEQTRRGHYLEPSVLAWFHDQRPDMEFGPCGLIRHPAFDWVAATPDEMCRDVDGKLCCVEAKTSDLDWQWGDEDTDQVPAGYYDQAQWQMFTLGIDRCYMPVLMSGLRFQKYVIEYNQEYALAMCKRGREFMETLYRNQRPSLDPMDGHIETYKAIRELNPGIDDTRVDVDPGTAAEFCISVENRKRAEVREQAAKNMLAKIGGNAHYVVCGDTKLLTKQSRGGGTPYYVAARGLPTIEDK